MTAKLHDLKGVKLCRISTVPFSMVTQLRGQIDFFCEIGMNVSLVSSDGPELQELEFDDSLGHTRIDIARQIKPWADFLALVNLYLLFRNEKFDIVHSITPKAGLLTSIAGFLAGIPIRLHTFTGQQWVCMSGLVRFVSRMADRLVGWLNTRCYADSKSQRLFLIDEGLISSRKIKVLGHGSLAGVDMDRFRSDRWSDEEKKQIKEELGISQASSVLLFIGRITREKGIRELLNAFQRVQEIQKYKVELLILGPLDENRGGSCGICEADLAGNGVHFIDYHSVPEKFLAISDLLCLPSYREGFGTVVIEAAAMGVPTLGSMINGLIDAVEDGLTGVLVQPKNDEALYDALCFLLDNPQEMKKLGEAAYERCLRLFDASLVGSLTTEEYSDLRAR